MKKKILVEGMKCVNCAKHVKESLTSLDGVTSVNVNLDEKAAFIEASCDISDEAIKMAVNSEKYNVAEIEVL